MALTTDPPAPARPPHLVERKRVLILDADGRAGLACVQSLGPPGHEVHVAVRARGSLTESSRWCHAVYLQPPFVPTSGAIDWLTDLDRRFDFTLVIATTEASLRWMRTFPQDHQLRRKAVLPSDRSIDEALNKELTLARVTQLGIAVAPSRLLEKGAAPQLPRDGYPLVLKPIISKVLIGNELISLSVAIARDARERDAFLAATLPFTAVQEQAWVPGRGVGVEMLFDHGRLVWSFIHERLHEWPLTGGASTLRRSAENDPALVEQSRRLLEALEWNGVAMVEWRKSNEDVYHFIEINPRLWGSLPLTIAAGIDIPRGLLSLAENQPLPLAPKWRVGISARNLTADLHWCFANARADHTDPLLLTEPVLKSLLGWLRPMSGGEVWDGWSLSDPKVAWAELYAVIHHMAARPVHRMREIRTQRRLKRNHVQLLRQLRAELRPMKKILFLCYGNICRSPFAAQLAQSRLPEVHIESAGFHLVTGRRSPSHMVEISRTFDIDLNDCVSKQVTRELAEAADLILLMDLKNLANLERLMPAAMARTTLLGFFDGDAAIEIDDPYALSPTATTAVLERIVRAIEALAAWVDETNFNTSAAGLTS